MQPAKARPELLPFSFTTSRRSSSFEQLAHVEMSKNDKLAAHFQQPEQLEAAGSERSFDMAGNWFRRLEQLAVARPQLLQRSVELAN